MKAPLTVPRRARGERGQILIITAVSMVAILGVAALAIDASYLYDKRQKMYAAADAAARSVAVEILYNNPNVIGAPGTGAAAQGFANAAVSALGFDAGGTTSVVPTCGTWSGSAFSGGGNCTATSYVQVVVSEPTGTFFAKALPGAWSTVTPVATAIAGPTFGTDCVVALGTPGSTAYNVDWGGSSVNVDAPNCTIAVQGQMDNSNRTGTGLDVLGISVSSTASSSTSCDRCPSGSFTTGAPPPYDPMPPMPAPAAGVTGTPSSHCTNYSVPGSDSTCTAGTYNTTTMVMDTSSTRTKTWTFAPGEYTFLLGLSTTCAGSRCPIVNMPSSASGSVLYISGGSISVAGSSSANTRFNLTAPTAGVYKGVAIYQPLANTNTLTFANADNVSSSSSSPLWITGLIYAPGANVTFGLTSSSSSHSVRIPCFGVVAKAITATGNASVGFESTCAANPSYGGPLIRTVLMAQ